MAIISRWYNDAKTIVITEFDSEWEWNDFHTEVRKAHALMASVPYTVDLLMLHRVELPAGNPMVHFNKVARNQPGNTGKVVAVALKANVVVLRFLTVLSNVIEKVHPSKSRVFVVGSLEEAQALLTSHESETLSL